MKWNEIETDQGSKLKLKAFVRDRREKNMAHSSSFVVTLSHNFFKRNVTTVFAHSHSLSSSSSSYLRSRSLPSLFFSHQRTTTASTPLTLTASFSSSTAMGETAAPAADAAMDAVQRRLMFEDESVPLSII